MIDALDVASGARFPDGAAITIGGMDAVNGKTEAAEGIGEERISTDGHGAGRVAVIGVLESDDGMLLRMAGILPILHGDFQRDFDGG